MAIIIFRRLLEQAEAQGITMKKTVDARDWLRGKAQEVRAVDPNRILRQGLAERARNVVMPGRMYLFRYEPKLKDDLPYYDKFPLVFPFRKDSKGFYGLNMHYLPLTFRALLMDSLYPLIQNEQRQDETTRLRMTYNLLNSSAKFKWFKPCVKHYLNNQVQTRFVYIEPAEWDVAMFLPLQRFVGATLSKVHRDSRKIITGT